jgi:1,4-dihydroxy-2-naphthoate octaprenyltransferase
MAETSPSPGTTTSETSQARSQNREAQQTKHVHHGRTPAAWAGVAIAGAGFLLGGIALVDHQNWVLFWIGAALCVVAVIVTAVLQKLGYGAS